jgi:hypothetical protein
MARVNHDIEPDSTGGNGQDNRRPARVRRFFQGEDPLEFAFPLLRIAGLRVRVHWVLVLYVACELVLWFPRDRIGLEHIGALLGTLVALVIVREIGRGLFARGLGSKIGHVTVWPVGGLNSVATPDLPRPVLAEMGGLLINAALAPLLAAGAWASGMPLKALIVNPFTPSFFLSTPSVEWTPLHLIICSAYYTNLVLLGLNLLLPMFPMDAGRMLAAASRVRGAFYASGERAGRFGMFSSVALFIIAAMLDQNRLMALAFCGFLATLAEFRRAQFLTGPELEEVERDEVAEPVRTTSTPGRQAESKSGHCVTEGDLDRVLEKISREGLSSLTAPERDVLTRETERRRRE